MIVFFDGHLSYKAYHDPGTSTIDLVSSEFAEEGRSGELGGGLSVGLDAEDNVRHLSLDLSADPGDLPLPNRPAEAPSAVAAEVECLPEALPRHHFDASAGTLRLAFGSLDTLSWARLGTSLVWLAIDEDSCLAAVIVEGISKDPGGKAQAAWLQEMSGPGE